RLSQTIDYDGVSHNNDIIKQFKYTQTLNPAVTSGVLFNLPVYAYVENFYDYWDRGNQGTTGPGVTTEFDPSTIDYYNHNLVIGDIPQFTMSGFDGLNVAYSEVTEVSTGNGKTVSAYSTPGRYGDLSDQPGNCDPGTYGYCDGLFTLPTPSKWSRVSVTSCFGTPNVDKAPDLIGTDIGTNYTNPYAPTLNYDWNRGLLMSKVVYKENGAKVTEEHNSYSLYSPQNSGPMYVLGLRNQRLANYILSQNFCAPGDYDCFSQYRIITNVAKLLSSKILQTYDSGGLTSTQTSSNYTYSANCMNPSLIETSTSKGDLIDKYMTYPPDYAGLDGSASNPGALALYNVQQQHIIDPVVEEYTLRKNADGTNPRVTDAYLTTFKVNQPLADIVYRSEYAGAIANFVPSGISDAGITKDPNYQPFLSFDAYDANGNILQQHQIATGSPNSSYIWDYNKQYPIAKVTNAVLSDIAYTSFEADGSGGWNFDPLGINSDPTAPTGGKCYSLSYAHVSNNNLIASKSYIISYWIKNQTTALGITNGSTYLTNNSVAQGPTINGWTYFQHTISGTTHAQFVGSCFVDELRLYPADGQMTTYTYSPLAGLISSTDAKGEISYYEYDNFQRLINIKDKDKNVVKHMDYHYLGQ
ncbi:MAG: hypothetical protein JWR09_5488, partial [Mucilaginibacter sp.]|nr:hypothetical protein [Mucilaginibacter sp.]